MFREILRLIDPRADIPICLASDEADFAATQNGGREMAVCRRAKQIQAMDLLYHDMLLLEPTLRGSIRPFSIPSDVTIIRANS